MVQVACEVRELKVFGQSSSKSQSGQNEYLISVSVFHPCFVLHMYKDLIFYTFFKSSYSLYGVDCYEMV